MNQCLVKQLKATVNNPNLPIVETMQQITLNAIALSGNNTMTDEQKYALNHFYYQLGAISNSSLWQKIQGIILPFLANDEQHSVADYKSNTIYSSTLSSNFMKSGGFIQVRGGSDYHDLFEYDFDAADFSFIDIMPTSERTGTMIQKTSLSESDVFMGKVNSSNNLISGLYASSSSSDIIYRYFSNVPSIKGLAFSFGNSANLINGLYRLGDDSIAVIDNKPSYDAGYTYPSYSNAKMKLINSYTGGLIIGKAMTAEELSLVFTNLISLFEIFSAV